MAKYLDFPTDRDKIETYLYERNSSYLDDLIADSNIRKHAARQLLERKMDPENYGIYGNIKPFLQSVREHEWLGKKTVIFTTMVDEGLIPAFDVNSFFQAHDINILSHPRDSRKLSINAVLPISARLTPMASQFKMRKAALKALRKDHEEYTHLFITRRALPVVPITTSQDSMGHVILFDFGHDLNTKDLRISRNGSTVDMWETTGCERQPPLTIHNVPTISTLKALKAWRPEFSADIKLVFGEPIEKKVRNTLKAPSTNTENMETNTGDNPENVVPVTKVFMSAKDVDGQTIMDNEDTGTGASTGFTNKYQDEKQTNEEKGKA